MHDLPEAIFLEQFFSNEAKKIAKIDFEKILELQ